MNHQNSVLKPPVPTLIRTETGAFLRAVLDRNPRLPIYMNTVTKKSTTEIRKPTKHQTEATTEIPTTTTTIPTASTIPTKHTTETMSASTITSDKRSSMTTAQPTYSTAPSVRTTSLSPVTQYVSELWRGIREYFTSTTSSTAATLTTTERVPRISNISNYLPDDEDSILVDDGGRYW